MRLGMLGPLEVVDGERRVPIRAGKESALLAILLLHANRTVPTTQLVDDLSTLQIRTASHVGYGVSPEMLRRCFERLDRERITGRVEIVQTVSDAHPVATQGPVFRLGGRSV